MSATSETFYAGGPYPGAEIEIVAGEAPGTCSKCKGQSHVLAWFDTSNGEYAGAALCPSCVGHLLGRLAFAMTNVVRSLPAHPAGHATESGST